MECPYCSAELEDNGNYGYLAEHQSGEVLGQIYKCHNAKGFKDKEGAEVYLNEIGETVKTLNLIEWEEVTCDSSMHYISGSFHTDKQGNLHTGYPC